MKAEQVADVVEELIEVLIDQAAVLEKLVVHVEQVTSRLPDEPSLSVVRSSLSGLHHRIKKLQEHEILTHSPHSHPEG